MNAHRRNDYWLPTAWRGVASPRYLRMTRWHALAEELGGMRAFSSGAQMPLNDSMVDPICKVGLMDMSLLSETLEGEQLDEVQRFVVDELTRHERLVLMLFYAEGLRLTEIAEVLDLPDATVAELFSHTLATLRARFG